MDKVVFRKISFKVILNIMILLLIIFLVILITNLPSDVTFFKLQGKIQTNINTKLYKAAIIDSVKGLISGEYFNTTINTNGMKVGKFIKIGDAIKIAFSRSMTMFFISFILSTIIGIPKGIFDSRRKNKQSTFKLLQTLIPLSVPDVLTISLIQIIALRLYNNNFTIFGIGPIRYIGYGDWTYYIYPIIALSLIPAAYIARVTSTSIETVYDRDYILAARGKGCSEIRIILNHCMRNVITDLIASFPAIVSIMFSSLFVVERLFYFPGITFEMMDFYMKLSFDGSSTIALLSFAVVLVIIYFILYTALDIVSKVVVPKLKN